MTIEEAAALAKLPAAQARAPVTTEAHAAAPR